MKKFILLLLAGLCLTASAQLYRKVNGQIYKSDDPSVWHEFYSLRITDVAPDGTLIVQQWRNAYATGTSVGMKDVYSAHTSQRTLFGQPFALKNYRSNLALEPGMIIGPVKAMLVPGGYDMGTAWYPPVVPLTPAQVMAQKMAKDSNIVAYLKVQATNGMPDEQCELGERYMKGDGVVKDTTAGMMWLQKSAGQGNLEASNDIQQLTLTNSVTAEK